MLVPRTQRGRCRPRCGTSKVATMAVLFFFSFFSSSSSSWILGGWGTTDASIAARSVAEFLPRLLTATVLPVVFCSAWMVPNPPALRSNRHLHGKRRRRPRRRRRDPLYSTASPTAANQPATERNNNNSNNNSKSESNHDKNQGFYRSLYPRSNASSNGTIQIEGANSVHTLYYEIHGSGPLNALFLHGGPGAGCFPNHARFFDPSKYTVVLLDQRGAGRSTPRGCVEDNTLDNLVEDCERVRKALFSGRTNGDDEDDDSNNNKSNNNNNNNNGGEPKPWDCVLGGSWGATLGLAYAQRYPRSMKSLVLRGICALRTPEVDWLFSSEGGSARILGEAWKNFSEAVGVDININNVNNVNNDVDVNDSARGGRDVLHAYYDCLLGSRNDANGTADNSLRLAAARSWMMWEMAATSSASSSRNGNRNRNNENATISPVLVSSPEIHNGAWRLETPQGEPVAGSGSGSGNDDDENAPGDPETMASQLRRNISEGSSSSSLNADGTTNRPVGPRPVRPVDESIPLLAAIRDQQQQQQQQQQNSTPGQFRVSPDYVPAQAMLTCFYSVNNRYAMGHRDLIRDSYSYSYSDNNYNDNDNHSDNDNDETDPNAPPIRIIGVQGGLDPICPPDTALDLLQAIRTSSSSSSSPSSSSSNSKNTMELRIPLHSGHSMYDPGIQHELVQATDRLADELLNSNSNSSNSDSNSNE